MENFGKELDNNKNLCIYCNEKIHSEDDKHFVSDCCGRGMCEKCFVNLQGTDQQMQVAFWDNEPQDDEIFDKCGWNSADYICFKCFSNWAYFVK